MRRKGTRRGLQQRGLQMRQPRYRDVLIQPFISAEPFSPSLGSMLLEGPMFWGCDSWSFSFWRSPPTVSLVISFPRYHLILIPFPCCSPDVPPGNPGFPLR